MKLQHYLLKKSDSKLMVWVVGILTVFESIFLFIPPEVFMTPPIVANKKKAVPVVIAASVGSIVGGIISCLIGVLLLKTLGAFLINNFAHLGMGTCIVEMRDGIISAAGCPQIVHAQALFDKYGFWLIFITAVTPVPYKLVAMFAGFALDTHGIITFIALSAVFRTGRFAIVGYLLWRFQEQANAITKKYFWPLTLGAIALAAAGIFLMAVI